MTFQPGFAVTQELSLSDWRLETAAGKPLVGSVSRPTHAGRGTMVEIDTQRGRARVPFGRGVYLATDLTPGLRRTIVNLAENAAKAIDAIMKAQDADLVAQAASTWIGTNQQFCWTRNLPWQLEMLGFATGDLFRAVRLTHREIFIVGAEAAGGCEWAVPIGDIHLDDVGFDDDASMVHGHGVGLPLVDNGPAGDQAGSRVASDRQWLVAS
ncbi:MAG: hypothetical protein ABWZ98_07815 [Nakamurella sp.]